jgi:hypothetical protein
MFSHITVEQYLQKQGIKKPTIDEVDSENARLTELYSGLDHRNAAQMSLFELLIVEYVFKHNKPKIKKNEYGLVENPVHRAQIFDSYFNIILNNKTHPSSFYGNICCDIISKMSDSSSISLKDLNSLYEKTKSKLPFASFMSEVTDEKFIHTGSLLKKTKDKSDFYQFYDKSIQSYFEILLFAKEDNLSLPEFFNASEEKVIRQDAKHAAVVQPISPVSRNRYSFSGIIDKSYPLLSEESLEEDMEKHDLSKDAIVIFAKAIKENDLKSMQNEFKELSPLQKQGLLEMILDLYDLGLSFSHNLAPFGSALDLANQYKHPDIIHFLESEHRQLPRFKR